MNKYERINEAYYRLMNEKVKSRTKAKDFKNVTIELRDEGLFAIKNKKEVELPNNEKLFQLLSLSYTPENLKKVFSDKDLKDGEKAKKLIQKL